MRRLAASTPLQSGFKIIDYRRAGRVPPFIYKSMSIASAMKKWSQHALLIALILTARVCGSDTGAVRILGTRRKLRMHGTPRRKQQRASEANYEDSHGATDTSLSDGLKQLPSFEMDDETGGEQESLLQDGALGDQDARDTEQPQDDWGHGPSTDLRDG